MVQNHLYFLSFYSIALSKEPLIAYNSIPQNHIPRLPLSNICAVVIVTSKSATLNFKRSYATKINLPVDCTFYLLVRYSNGNDHGLFNKGDEPSMPRWSARPTFYYLYYFQHFFGDKVLAASSNDQNVLVYASTFGDGKLGVVLINIDSADKIVSILINQTMNKKNVYSYTLTGGNDNEPFSQKVVINGVESSLPAGGPDNFTTIKADSYSFKNEIKLLARKKAVLYLLIE